MADQIHIVQIDSPRDIHPARLAFEQAGIHYTEIVGKQAELLRAENRPHGAVFWRVSADQATRSRIEKVLFLAQVVGEVVRTVTVENFPETIGGTDEP